MLSTQFLPFECLEQVFVNLLHNKSTLFNCLLVNRSWCRQVVPLLWSRPFNRLQWKPSSQLIQTYISCMTKEEKTFFTDLEIILPESTLSQPLFNYSKYLRKLNYQELSIYVNTWYCINVSQYRDNNNDDYFKIDLIIKELGNFIIHHSNLIYELYISKVFFFSKITDITSLPEASISFSHLRKIKITGSRDMEFIDFRNLSKILFGLSKICTRIREIEIYKFHETNSDSDLIKGLIELIKAQQSLSKFVISCWNLNLNPLIPALETQISSLKEFEFMKTKFDNSTIFNLLALCPHLQAISLQQCDGLSQENIGPIINSSVGLKKLNLCDNDMTSDTLTTLLRNTKSTLNQLILDEHSTEISTNLIKTISTHCLNLSYLDMKVLNVDMINLLGPLRCSKLEHLILNNASSKDFYDDEKFPEIGNFLPKTLQHLSLIYWDFTIKSLKSFFENCDCPLKKLFLYKDNGLNDDHLNIIIQYARGKGKGTLKSLNFLFRYCGNDSIPSQEAVKRAQEFIPTVQGK